MTLGDKDQFLKPSGDCSRCGRWYNVVKYKDGLNTLYLCGICIVKMKLEREEERRKKHGKFEVFN